MEDPKPAQPAPNQVPKPPTSTTQTPPTQPPPSLPTKTNKRSLDTNLHFQQNSKMRAVLKDLRPHFLEVFRSPEFRNCKAAHEIRKKIELLLELHKQTVTEAISVEKIKNNTLGKDLSAENPDSREPQDQPQNVKTTEQSQQDKVSAKPSENKFQSNSIASEKQQWSEDSQNHGSYVVGGSAFGWNFITFSGKEPVYYGVTKETFRAGK